MRPKQRRVVRYLNRELDRASILCPLFKPQLTVVFEHGNNISVAKQVIFVTQGGARALLLPVTAQGRALLLKPSLSSTERTSA